MSDFDFDLFVIGGGSGGVRAARMSAEHGARVGLAEEFRYGGTCVIRGCVPKKLLVYASAFSQAFADARGYGWEVGQASFDWSRLRAAKEAEITRLEGVYRKNLEAAGVTLFDQRATVTSPHAVRLADGREVSTRHILIATGATPFVPEVAGGHLAITSNEAFDLDRLPRRIVIVGGGYIAGEFAGIFNGLGSHVTLCYRRDLILRGFDDDIRKTVQEGMRGRGIDLLLEDDIEAIEDMARHLEVHFRSGEIREAGLVMYATGRNPNTAGLGLRELGVKLAGNGAVMVDAWSQTSVPSIFAVGDVTDRLPLTPVAIREGAAFADTVFGAIPTRPDHALVASAVFTQPEAATVGLTEAEAREQGEIEVYRAVFRPMQYILAGREEKMLVKLVVARDSRRLLGVHIVGPAAAEMIQLAAVALKMGATKEDFDRTVAVHPTAAEELVTMRVPAEP
ncbi:MAG TPA: glutathione-disulfide reductase [Thermohalobaculum sp.]|nr:glutathione-disulfide reductase [Thermohalobaculum sp.]